MHVYHTDTNGSLGIFKYLKFEIQQQGLTVWKHHSWYVGRRNKTWWQD